MTRHALAEIKQAQSLILPGMVVSLQTFTGRKCRSQHGKPSLGIAFDDALDGAARDQGGKPKRQQLLSTCLPDLAFFVTALFS